MKIFLVWVLVGATFAFLLNGLMATGSLVFLSLFAATSALGGCYLIVGSLSAHFRSSSAEQRWLALSLAVGVVMVTLAAMTLLPLAPVSILVKAPFGRQVLENRGDLFKKAVSDRDEAKIERLANLGLSHRAPRDSFGRPLIESVQDAFLLGRLLQAGLDPDVRDEDGLTLLMKTRDVEIARVLLESGASPDLRDDLGRTALMMAPNRGLDIVEALLDGEVSLDSRDDQGRYVADYFQSDPEAWALLEKSSRGPLVVSDAELDVRNRGRRDWLRIDQQLDHSMESSVQSAPETFYYGDQAIIDITLANNTSKPQLLKVEAELNLAAFFVSATQGGRIALPDEAPLQRTIRWPLLSLPESSVGELKLHIVAREGMDAGDLSINVGIVNLVNQDEFPTLNLYREMTYPPGIGSTRGWWLLMLVFPATFIAWAVAAKRFPSKHPVRTAINQFAAGAFAGLLLLICLGLLKDSTAPYFEYEETTCTILDRRADLQSSKSSTSSGSRKKNVSTNYLRPVVAASYQAGGDERISTTFLSGISASMADLDNFAIGDEVVCWYDPENMTSFVLLRRVGFGTSLLLLLFGGGAAGLIWWLINSFGHTKTAINS